MESGEFTIIKEDVNLNEFIGNVYYEYKIALEKRKNKEIDFILEIGDQSKEIRLYTDEYRLREVIVNLLDNAFKFTLKGFVKLGYILKSKQVIFYIKDSGKGVCKKNQILIFNHFFQEDVTETKEYGGLGLGLTISKSVVEKLGGKIWIESNLNIGTTFCFNIPLKEMKESKIKSERKIGNGLAKIEK